MHNKIGEAWDLYLFEIEHKSNGMLMGLEGIVVKVAS